MLIRRTRFNYNLEATSMKVDTTNTIPTVRGNMWMFSYFGIVPFVDTSQTYDRARTDLYVLREENIEFFYSRLKEIKDTYDTVYETRNMPIPASPFPHDDWKKVLNAGADIVEILNYYVHVMAENGVPFKYIVFTPEYSDGGSIEDEKIRTEFYT